MAKKKKRREKSISEYEVEEGQQFKPHRVQPHVAMEYRDKGSMEIAHDLCRNMTTKARRAVLSDPRPRKVFPRREEA